MSDLKPVTLYCCKGCQHLHHEIVTSCDCGTGCDPFEYELWEARRTQPEATAPAQDQQLVVATSTETGFFHVVISLNDGKRMLVLYDKQHSLNGDTVGVADVPAAALASSANALSAGDRVDALQEIATKLRRAGADIPAPQHDDAIKGATINGLSIALLLVDEAILQSQKGGSHG